MIVEFSVKNFRSIKELQTISFAATKLDSNQDKFPDIDRNNIVEEDHTRLLKTIGIYGPNGSGKSNIIRSLEYFINAIKSEASQESQMGLVCDPFLFQDNPRETESFFQIVLILKGKKYRYGFTIKKNTSYNESVKSENPLKESKDIITNEWLYGSKEKNVVELFTRENLAVSKDKLPDNEKIPSLNYSHNLFLTYAAAFDKDGICATIRSFFNSFTISNFSHGLDDFRRNTLFLLQHEKKKDEFLDLLWSFNLKYSDIIIEEDKEKPERVLSRNKIYLVKNFKDARNEIINVRLNLNNNESEGTKKLFDIAGLLLRAFNLPHAGLIILDDLDSDFHPSLLIRVIELFNDSEINKSKCQLLFASHDTNLMEPWIMRRDQFYFTEKDENDSTRLYSLSDLKGIRNDADFAKQYLAGFYGALPILEDYTNKIPKINEGTLDS